FGAALFADDAAVLHALVLAAQALVVLDRSEDGGAEQAVTFRLERTVVDGFRLLHFAEGPRTDQVRRGQRDLDRVEVQRLALLVEEVEQVFHVLLRDSEFEIGELSERGCRTRDRRFASPESRIAIPNLSCLPVP